MQPKGIKGKPKAILTTTIEPVGPSASSNDDNEKVDDRDKEDPEKVDQEKSDEQAENESAIED